MIPGGQGADSSSRRFLVVKLSSLGDLFHALPAVHLLRMHTGATIDWVCHDIYSDLVRCFDDVSGVISFPRASFPTKGGAFLRALRAERYEMAFDMQGLLKSALVARCARAGGRMGPSFSREGSRLFYDSVSGPMNKERHAVDENLDTVKAMGFAASEVVFPVTFPAFAGELPAGRRIGILPCSRRAEKNWPVERFRELARELRAGTGAALVLLGGKADEAVCRSIADAAGGGAQVWAGRTSIVELGGLLRDLDLLVTVDSGPMHIAAALGTPTVAIFGPTDPLRTGPYGRGHVVVRRAGPIAEIPVGDVLEAVQRATGSA